jgi:hypothetical protein
MSRSSTTWSRCHGTSPRVRRRRPTDRRFPPHGFARLSPGRARRTTGVPAPGVPAGPDRSGLVRARCPSRSGDRRGRVRRRRTWRRRNRRRCAAGAWSSPSVASRPRVCGRRRARRRGGGGVAPCAGSGPCGRAGGRDVARAPLTGSTPSGPVLAAHVVLLPGAGDGLVGQVQFLPRTGGPLSASEAG